MRRELDPALGIDSNGLGVLQKFHGTQGAFYMDTGIGVMIG